jgi:GDP-L-fucose synthase
MTKPKIYVAGHNGMVGSAILRILEKQKDVNLITRSRTELDLTNQASVQDFFAKEKLDQVYIASAKVGGIHANNTYPAEFIYENIMIEANLINSAFLNGVKKLLFLGSSCIYPKFAQQPMKEEYLLTGLLESTNEPYAIAKIAGIKLCESYNRQYGDNYGIDYRSVMPTNLYGIGDNYHSENSHVIPGLIRRFHEAKINNLPEVVMWGTGTPLREFLYVDDLARIILDLIKIDALPDWINIGSSYEYSIAETANMIKETVRYTGSIVNDLSKPDGTPRKKLDISLLESLIKPQYTDFRVGLQAAYADFLKDSTRK